MVEIHLYSGNSKEPVEIICTYCNQVIGSKACVVIILSDKCINWYCSDCIKINDFSHGEFLCGM